MSFLTVDTNNSKITGKPRRGFAAALTLPIANTCPDTCTLKTSGECYAKGGRMAIHVRRLENANVGRDVLSIAKEAAREIATAAAAGLAHGRPLRLFQAGDAKTKAAAEVLAKASRLWLRSGGRAVWGYTHAWRTVPAKAWRGVAMLASVESQADAEAAKAAGYVPARIVASHPVDGKAHKEGSITWIPCPEQTRGVPCVACGLCLDAEALKARNAGIEFAAHGIKVTALKRRLPVLDGRQAAFAFGGAA